MQGEYHALIAPSVTTSRSEGGQNREPIRKSADGPVPVWWTIDGLGSDSDPVLAGAKGRPQTRQVCCSAARSVVTMGRLRRCISRTVTRIFAGWPLYLMAMKSATASSPAVRRKLRDRKSVV